MIVRLAAVVAVLASFIVLGMPTNGSGLFQPTTAAAAPVGAPAATWTNGLEFSTSVDSNARAEHPRVEFDGSTHTVWASFEFHDHDSNAKVTALIRANGTDYRVYKLDCCDSSNGRYAFPIEKRNGGGDLPGAAYDARVYVNDAEIAHGGFGVNGRGGLDNDDEGQGNDNN